jgi:hypothetical integral membrane protein (TIGR02206 family)
MPSARFVPFGPSHLAALTLIGVAAGSLAWLQKARGGSARALRGGIGAAILGLAAFEIGQGVVGGWLGLEQVLPLQLCDLATLLALYALATLRRAAAELVYFWAGAGTLVALVSPDLAWDFPRWEFLVFFGLHGLVMAAAALLTFGLGLVPRSGAAGRAYLLTVVYAAVVGAVNVALGTNFMYLCRKPSTPTVLDAFGPWPVYLPVGAGVAAALFAALDLPFRRKRLSRSPTIHG